MNKSDPEKIMGKILSGNNGVSRPPSLALPGLVSAPIPPGDRKPVKLFFHDFSSRPFVTRGIQFATFRESCGGRKKIPKTRANVRRVTKTKSKPKTKLKTKNLIQYVFGKLR